MVSGEEFSLDTSAFDDIIAKCKSLAEKMSELKNDMDTMKSHLMMSWSGRGRDAFEKKYRLLTQQFGDLKDDVWDFSERLLEYQGNYIQTDVDAAKALDGVTNRY